MNKPNGFDPSGLPSPLPANPSFSRMPSQRQVLGNRRIPASAGEPPARSALASKKMAEEKTRARTLARVQAVSERLSTATEEVGSAIIEATSAVQELEKTTQSIASQMEQASSAAEESRAAINEIEKAADTAN